MRLEERLLEPMEEMVLFPRYFEIETVNACNARCPMCTIDDWDRRDGLMEDWLFAKIVNEISEHKDEVRRVHLYRDGEPLLDKKLANKIAMMKNAGVRRVGISTNAALLDRVKSERLLLAGLDEIILSVDSLTPRVYEEIRKGLKYEDVLWNCLNFIEIRDRMKSSCQVWMRMIRQEANYDEWPEYERFWKTKLKSTDRLDYRNLHNWGSQLATFKAISPADVKQPCVALWSLMVVFANGDVPLCNVDYNNKHPLGNLRDSTIEDLWTSKLQNERREIHYSGRRNEIDMCNGCTVWS